MNKKLAILFLGILCMELSFGTCYAQFVNFRLEIIPGVTFGQRVNSLRELGTWESNQSRAWVGFEVQDNTPLLIDISYPEGEIIPQPNTLFLNDGSSDFGNAFQLVEKISCVQTIYPSKLIQNQNPRPKGYLAWLGLPILEGIYVRIEY